jgi:hypothetical protein
MDKQQEHTSGSGDIDSSNDSPAGQKTVPPSGEAPSAMDIGDYHLLEFGMGSARTALARQYMFKLVKLCFVYFAKLLKKVTRSRKHD